MQTYAGRYEKYLQGMGEAAGDYHQGRRPGHLSRQNYEGRHKVLRERPGGAYLQVREVRPGTQSCKGRRQGTKTIRVGYVGKAQSMWV